MRLWKATLTVLGAALLGAQITGTAAAQELRVSSFEPPTGFYSQEMLGAWIETVSPLLEKASLRLYPGSILGPAAAQRDLVLSGVADIALIVPAYTPGVFPRTSAIEMPYLAKSSQEGTRLLWSLYDEGTLAQEYGDYKLIGLFATTPYGLITGREDVAAPENLKGLRLRSPSPYVGGLIGALGGTAVSLPAPQVYESLDRDVIDGAMWNVQAYDSFRLYEVAPRFVDLRLSATPIVVLMNKASYQRLSEADRQVIDAHSGRWFSDWIAKKGDDFDAERRQALAAAGKLTVVTPTPEQEAEWRKVIAHGVDLWLAYVEKAGLPQDEARKVADRIYALAAH